jgi:hypothetical protein
MTSQSVWDDPSLKSGEFVKFETVGDSIAGVINSIRVHTWPDGSAAPQIALTTDQGEDRTMTASQVQLKAALATQRPDVGDHIAVRYTSEEKRSGGKTLKHFDVKVTKKADLPATQTPATTGRQSFDDNPPF